MDVFEGPEFLTEILGQPLAQGKLPAVGVSLVNGTLLRIPPAAWRRLHRNREGSSRHFTYPVEAALTGQEVWIGDEPSDQPCYAAVALSDLARCLDAKRIPPEPRERPANGPMGSAPNAVPVEAAAPPRGLGGRPTSHDWDAFWIEVAHFVAENGLAPDNRAALQQHLYKWTAQSWKQPPDESTIRKRLQRLYGRSGEVPSCTAGR